MALNMKRLKSKSIVLLLCCASVVLVGYFILRQTERLLRETFEDKVVMISDSSAFKVTHGGLDISIVKQSFELKDVLILPDSLPRDKQISQSHIAIASVKAIDFDLLPLLLRKQLNIGQIDINGLELTYHKGQMKKPKPNSSVLRKSKKENQLSKVEIASISITDYHITKLSDDLKDSLSTLKGETLTITDVNFEKPIDKKRLRLNPSQLGLSATKLFGTLGGTEVKLPKFHFNCEQGSASLEGLQIGNPDLLRKKTERQQFNTPVNSVEIPVMNFYGIQTISLLESKNILADSLVIDEAVFTIVKNTAKPWNTNKTIALPHHLLRNARLKVCLEKLLMHDAVLDYKEYHNSKEMHLPIDQIELVVDNLGWKNETEKENAMNVDITGRMFDDFLVSMNINFPDPIENDRFQFTGSTDSFNFETFNPIMVPTSNIKFESGRVQRINFNGTGNADETSGEFVMVYDNLTTTVLRHKDQRKNKTFSWLANTAVRKENPKHGKLKIAQMEYQRVPYKGFGNYMFKTIESGLINSVYPFGKRKAYR